MYSSFNLILLSLSLFAAVDCQGLTPPLNGQISYVGGTTFGATATYSCNEGYDLDGEGIRICESLGEWSGMEPTCTCKLMLKKFHPPCPFLGYNNRNYFSFALYDTDIYTYLKQSLLGNTVFPR